MSRRLSQRELAARAGLPQSTVARIETGEIKDPSLSTMQRILEACDCWFTVAAEDLPDGISEHDAPEEFRDRAGRRNPAHLNSFRMDDGWWGWYRIAWPYGPTWPYGVTGEYVPHRYYIHRPRPPEGRPDQEAG